MSDEKRLERVELKVDDLKDEVTEMRVDFKVGMQRIEDHITGDEKIITEIQPLLVCLPALSEMAEDYTFKKKLKEEKKKSRESNNTKLKTWSLRISIFSGVLGLAYTVYSFR